MLWICLDRKLETEGHLSMLDSMIIVELSICPLQPQLNNPHSQTDVERTTPQKGLMNMAFIAQIVIFAMDLKKVD